MKIGNGIASAVALSLAAAPVIAPVTARGNAVYLAATNGKIAAMDHKMAVRPAAKQDAGSTDYKFDDGVSEGAVGFGNSGGSVPAIWFDQFTTVAGGEAVSAVKVAYGTPANSQPKLNGKKVTIGIWSDPKNEGDPTDAVLIAKQQGTISSQGTDSFITYRFKPAIVIGKAGTSFFAGVLTHAAKPPELYFLAIDTTTAKGKADSKGHSWIAAQATGGKVNMRRIGKNYTVATIDSFGQPGNWLIRVTGVGSK